MKLRAKTGLCLAIVTGVFCSVLAVSAQDVTPTPQSAGQPIATTVEVIVTGSTFLLLKKSTQPGRYLPQADITRLGARSATDFVQTLPAATGSQINDQRNNGGNGRANQPGVFFPKKLWCCRTDAG